MSKASPARSAASRRFSRTAFPLALVKFDVETRRAAARRPTDSACAARRTRSGEAIGRIGKRRCGRRRPLRGLYQRAASEKKILRDVFEPGDAWFRTGDLMRRTSSGFFYFVDRIGDTFRWKGENVATSEVAGGDRDVSGHHRGERLRRRDSGHRRPRRHGGDRAAGEFDLAGAAAPSGRAPAGLCAAAVPARPTGEHRNRPPPSSTRRAIWLREGYDPAAIERSRSISIDPAAAGIRAARRSAVRTQIQRRPGSRF